MNLKFRPVTEADTEKFHRYWTELLNENLAVLVPLSKIPSLEQNTRFVRSHSDGENSIMFVAAHEGIIRGVIHVTRIDRPMLDHTVTMGLNVQREYRLQGIGGKLLKKALEWAECEGDIERIQLEVLSNNGPAIYLYDREGFRVEGTKRKAVKCDGKYIDILLMARILGE